jgi:hypothetical protein
MFSAPAQVACRGIRENSGLFRFLGSGRELLEVSREDDRRWL